MSVASSQKSEGIVWKAIERRHYEQALALTGEARERYIVSLVERWPDGRTEYPRGIAREGWPAAGIEGDFERLTAEQIEQIVAEFMTIFEPPGRKVKRD